MSIYRRVRRRKYDSRPLVVQEVTGRNILSAEKFGKLELLLPEGSQLVLSTGPTVKSLTYKLRNFNDEDYLLLMGDPCGYWYCMCNSCDTKSW